MQIFGVLFHFEVAHPELQNQLGNGNVVCNAQLPLGEYQTHLFIAAAAERKLGYIAVAKCVGKWQAFRLGDDRLVTGRLLLVNVTKSVKFFAPSFSPQPSSSPLVLCSHRAPDKQTRFPYM